MPGVRCAHAHYRQAQIRRQMQQPSKKRHPQQAVAYFVPPSYAHYYTHCSDYPFQTYMTYYNGAMLTRYQHGNVTWIDLENPTSDEVRRTMEEFHLNHFVAEELLLPTMKPRVEF